MVDSICECPSEGVRSGVIVNVEQTLKTISSVIQEAELQAGAEVQSVITGVGGGVLRDIMAGRTPYIFVKHVYASAALAGALLCAGLWPVIGQTASMLTGFAVILTIRLLSAHYRWSLPHAEGDPPEEFRS